MAVHTFVIQSARQSLMGGDSIENVYRMVRMYLSKHSQSGETVERMECANRAAVIDAVNEFVQWSAQRQYDEPKLLWISLHGKKPEFKEHVGIKGVSAAFDPSNPTDQTEVVEWWSVLEPLSGKCPPNVIVLMDVCSGGSPSAPASLTRKEGNPRLLFGPIRAAERLELDTATGFVVPILTGGVIPPVDKAKELVTALNDSFPNDPNNGKEFYRVWWWNEDGTHQCFPKAQPLMKRASSASGVAEATSHLSGTILFGIGLLIAALLAGVSLYYATKLPDTALFYLKLVSFSVAALLGVVGVVKDFKDKDKKLTLAGKLNTIGLIFVAIVGIGMQRAESISTKKAADDLNQELARNMAPIGDTISVEYHAEIPLTQISDMLFQLGNDEDQMKMLNQHLRDEARRYDPHNADAHTAALANLNGKVVAFRFDRESSFASGDDITQSPLFDLAFYKTKPDFDKLCSAKADLSFIWDRNQKRADSDILDSFGKSFDDVTFMYQPNSALSELSEDVDSKFILKASTLSLQSVRDLSGTYVRLLSTHLMNPILYQLTVRVGGLPIGVDLRKPVGEGCYGRTYQLPVLGTNKAK